MKKSVFSLIILFLLATVIPEGRMEAAANPTSTVIDLLVGKSKSTSEKSKRLKKRKLKKVVRKVARVYRKGKTDRSKIKKSRKIQRKARRIINIF